MSSDIRQRPDAEEVVHKIAAAYTEVEVAPSVIADLVGAGLDEASVTVMDPWPTATIPRHPYQGQLGNILKAAFSTALVMGGVVWLIAWLWADPGRWVYGLFGMILGALTGTVASAISATSPPHWHDRLLGDPIGAVTVEVSTPDSRSAEVAATVLAGYEPSAVEKTIEPGPRAASEHVLWEHDEGLTPLEALGSRKRRPYSRPERRRRKGRHLADGRARG